MNLSRASLCGFSDIIGRGLTVTQTLHSLHFEVAQTTKNIRPSLCSVVPRAVHLYT